LTEICQNEGVAKEKVHFVGNVMIDTLIKHKRKALSSTICQTLSLDHKEYSVITLHRPSNVDSSEGWEKIIPLLSEMANKIKTVFPIHPRSIKRLEELNLLEKVQNIKGLKLTKPLGYIDFLKLMAESNLVMTDSGGMQEETTVLGVPCITLRENTERPSTVKIGTNTIVGQNSELAFACVEKILAGEYKKGSIPPLWDGMAAKRIVKILKK